MKLTKRVTALFLCFLMLSVAPVSAYAQTSVSGNDVVVVETTAPTETVASCEECGSSDAHTESCSLNIVAPLTTETPDETTEPTAAPTVATGSAISVNEVGCTECNQTEGHLDTCAQYVAPTDETTEPTTAPTEEVTEPTTTPTEETTEPSTEPAVIPMELKAEANGMIFKVSGELPEGTTLEVAALEDKVYDYIHSNILTLDALAEGYTGTAYDIKLMHNGVEIEPDENVTVNVQASDITAESDVKVYHLPNTSADDIYAAYQEDVMGIAMMDLQNDTGEITGKQIQNVEVGEGYFKFRTDGFSVYYILAGTQSDNSGNDTFYILPGTSVELTNVTNNNYTVTYPDNKTAAECGVSVSRSGNTLTFAATSSAVIGTYTISISNNRTATIVISTAKQMFELSEYQSVYFTSVRNSTNIPSEPMSGGNYDWTYITGVRNGVYSFTNGWGGAFTNSPDGFLDLDAIASSSALEQNLQGQNVIGVIDNGWGENTLPCVELTDEEWHEILKQFVEYTTVQISNGAGGTTVLTSDMVDEKLDDGSYRYKMYPYVIKLILESSEYQKGWHVDCAIVDTKTYSVSYEYNLPSSAVIQENSDLLKPEMAFYAPGTTGVEVGVMTLGNSEVTGDTSVTIYDTNTLSTSEYKFLYWNTSPDGSGTSYNPDDVLPAINSNVTLYAIWNYTQTSGTVKLQKTEVFEDSNDERKDDGVSYTFTVTIANAEAGKAYPYTIYNADNTIKTQNLVLVSGGTISLLGGEYAIVNNVPGGTVTITEAVADGSEFDVSWNVGSTTTEGNTVTATVTAGNQAEIVCINTYIPLVADLTITKTGAQAIDENQSFIFTVEGMGITLDVVINGNGSVTIQDLPIGEYTVTENTNWSWRYTPADGEQTITLTANDDNTVSFSNNRSWIYWLSGDSYNENQFTVKSKDEEN